MKSFDRVVTKAYKTARKYGGTTVTYTRSGTSGFTIADLEVVPGSTEYGVASSEQVVLESFKGKDFLLLSEELVVDDVLITPQSGDTITEYDELRDVENVYTVLRPTGEQMQVWEDAANRPDKRIVRVRTKETSVNNVVNRC